MGRERERVGMSAGDKKGVAGSLWWAADFGAAALAATSACFFTNPMEVAKSRLQLAGELSSGAGTPKAPSPVSMVLQIARREGIRGLQGGLAPAIGYQISMNGVRLGAYDTVRSLLERSPLSDVAGPFAVSVAAGAACGALGGVTGNPFFLAKVRLQTMDRTAAPRYSGTLDALVSVVRTEGGLRALWRGVDAQLLRVTIGSAVQLSVYGLVKAEMVRLGRDDGAAVHVLASAVTGMAVTLAMNPFDVVATRLYNQRIADGKGTLYSGALDCLVKTVRHEGVAGLYKGFLAHYLRLCPHTILTLVFWEQYKAAAQKLLLSN